MSIIIKENMLWPPIRNPIYYKMAEHSAWYSGDIDVLANFYSNHSTYSVLGIEGKGANRNTFWGRQSAKNDFTPVHVPIAGDIAETSANFLFSESPTVRIAEANDVNADTIYANSQKSLDDMLLESRFYSKILEAAEVCAGLGGVYIKIAWDKDLSGYPILVIEQADKAIPEFSFGILKAVTFWKVIHTSDDGNKVYRLLERYEKGVISYALYKGTSDRLGTKVSLKSRKETKGIEEVIYTVDELLAVYVPNILPNRLDRTSYMGRSDYLGIESLMDSLDQTFTSWMRDIVIAQGKILVPESFLETKDGKRTLDIDKSIFAVLNVDPVSSQGQMITPQQFEIRANEFEKTSLNLLDRIITAAGYSPQSFGLNIQGRAESGTALSMRERKSFSTKNKKEQYWGWALKNLIQLMILVYNEVFDGDIEPNINLNIEFGDSISNNMSELSTSVKMMADALAVSTETKVRLLHPDWDEAQIKAEVELILKENNIGVTADVPEYNLDTYQQMLLNNAMAGE